MNGSSILALVTARGGSKGIPGKNVALLGGRPLIVWTIEAALRSQAICRTVVSTDSEEIAGIARAAGAEVPFLRPAEFSKDDSPHVLAVEHALRWLELHESFRPDAVMLLQPTSPFRSAEDIDAAATIMGRSNAVAVVSVSEAKPHPFKTFRMTPDGTLDVFVRSELAYLRRQDLPEAFAENGAIYLNRPDSLLRERSFIPPGTVPYVMPAERSLDIDSEWDLHVANLIVTAGSKAR